MVAPSRSRRRIGAVAPALAAAVLAAGCSNAAGGSSDTGYVAASSGIAVIAAADRTAAPALSGTTLDGARLALADYRGDVVVVNVWGSWCTPCRVEGPALEETYEKYRARGVKFLGINTRDDNAAARAFAASAGLTYPSLQDPDEALVLEFKSVLPATTVPSSVIVDRSGKVAVRILGSVTEPQLVRELDAVLGEH